MSGLLGNSRERDLIGRQPRDRQKECPRRTDSVTYRKKKIAAYQSNMLPIANCGLESRYSWSSEVVKPLAFGAYWMAKTLWMKMRLADAKKRKQVHCGQDPVDRM